MLGEGGPGAIEAGLACSLGKLGLAGGVISCLTVYFLIGYLVSR